MRRQEAVIIVLPQTRQQCFQGLLDVSDGAERYWMTVSDMRGIVIDLNDLRPVGIELGPRKICSELKQHITVTDGMISRGLTEEARHPNIVRIVVRDKVLAPRGMGHRRLQPL